MSDAVGALVSLCDDLLLLLAGSESIDESSWSELSKRREVLHREAARGTPPAGRLDGDVASWVVARAPDLAAVAPPGWLPMSEVVASGVTLAGGARGVRSLFSSKLSEKEIARATRLGTLAFRALGVAVGADGEVTADERLVRQTLLASLALPSQDAALLAAAPLGDVTSLEIHGEIEPKTALLLLRGAWQGALRDGLDVREEGALAVLAGRLGVKPEDAAQARVAVEQATEQRRLFGRAIIDTLYWLLGDDLLSARPAATAVAGLLLPDPERTSMLASLAAGAPPASIERATLPRAMRAAALAAGWVVALRSDPTVSRRAVLAARHDSIAGVLDGDGGKAREAVGYFLDASLLKLMAEAAAKR